jgi:hypothetical protein
MDFVIDDVAANKQSRNSTISYKMPLLLLLLCNNFYSDISRARDV